MYIFQTVSRTRKKNINHLENKQKSYNMTESYIYDELFLIIKKNIQCNDDLKDTTKEIIKLFYFSFTSFFVIELISKFWSNFSNAFIHDDEFILTFKLSSFEKTRIPLSWVILNK
jgi:hypothetical protein